MGINIGALVPMALLWPPRRRTISFLAVNPEQALVIDLIPFPPQQDVQASIAEPSPLMGNGLHPLAQHNVIGPKRLVAHRHPATPQHSARPPLAHPIGSLEMGDSIPLGGGRYH
jgi:hypothetical protein